jgi:hypothetical protein
MNLTARHAIFVPILSIAAAAALCSAQPVQSPAPAACQQLMQEHQQFMQKIQERDEDLQNNLQQMNAATGQKKIDAMAALLNDLVSQRLQMHLHMQTMRDQMAAGGCRGMMGGMRPGMGGGMMPSGSPAGR